MRAHIIENGIVANTIEVESLDFLQNLVEATEGSIGWSYDGKKFSPPPPTAEPAPEHTDVLAKIAAMEAALAELRAQIV